MAMKKFQYKGYEISIQKINLVQESLPQDNYALFQTLSPIAIKGRNKNFLKPNEDGYEESFQYICNEIIKSVAGRDTYKPIQFTPIEMKKVVVKLKHNSFSMINQEGIYYVEAYKGLLRLEGAMEDLKLLTQTGVGYRRSEGFGVIEYVGQ
jgi:CRISPR-associated endoribonuclease Cas6